MGTYWSATRHPWPTLLLLTALLAAYELGVNFLAGSAPDAHRAGADGWVRQLAGIKQSYVIPLIVIGFWVLATGLSWGDRPSGALGVCLGMVLESVIWAVGLWSLSRNFGLILDHFGVMLQVAPAPHAATMEVLKFIGAGIYEEVIFRLVLFGGMVFLLRLAFIPALVAVPVGIIASSLLFAAAHHIGPTGEDMDTFVFLFRATAGVYFALLFQFRGFGVAVGAHAGYDILVGLNVT